MVGLVLHRVNKKVIIKMDNKNMPAMPIPKMRIGDRSVRGLSKREYIAALAMQGLVTDYSTGTPEQVAQTSVEYADALLSALDEIR